MRRTMSRPSGVRSTPARSTTVGTRYASGRFRVRRDLGVIPADAELTERHEEIPAWEEMDEALKSVLRRQMENYAGSLQHTDHHVGRVVQAVEDLGVLDDTIIYYMIGDNGASGEGTINGSFNEYIVANGLAAMETPESLTERLDRWPETCSSRRCAATIGVVKSWATPHAVKQQISATNSSSSSMPLPSSGWLRVLTGCAATDPGAMLLNGSRSCRRRIPAHTAVAPRVAVDRADQGETRCAPAVAVERVVEAFERRPAARLGPQMLGSSSSRSDPNSPSSQRSVSSACLRMSATSFS
jgi:hypothetical protein